MANAKFEVSATIIGSVKTNDKDGNPLVNKTTGKSYGWIKVKTAQGDTEAKYTLGTTKEGRVKSFTDLEIGREVVLYGEQVGEEIHFEVGLTLVNTAKKNFEMFKHLIPATTEPKVAIVGGSPF
jgi:hypothetical protein